VTPYRVSSAAPRHRRPRPVANGQSRSVGRCPYRRKRRSPPVHPANHPVTHPVQHRVTRYPCTLNDSSTLHTPTRRQRSAPGQPAKHWVMLTFNNGSERSALGHPFVQHRVTAFSTRSRCSATGHPISPKPLSRPRRTPRTDPEPALGTPLPTLSAALPTAQETPLGPTSEPPPPCKTPRIQGTFVAFSHPYHPDPKTTSAPLLTSGADVCVF
jgi:hypothetical protein